MAKSGQTASRVAIKYWKSSDFSFSHPFHTDRVLHSSHANEQSTEVQNQKEIQLNLEEIRLERSPNVAKNGQVNLLF